MARSISSIKLYCSAVLSSTAAPWNLDPKCLAIPWKGEVIQPKGRKLRFGIISDNDGNVSVQPPLVRGLAITKAALEAEGHEVITINLNLFIFKLTLTRSLNGRQSIIQR